MGNESMFRPLMVASDLPSPNKIFCPAAGGKPVTKGMVGMNMAPLDGHTGCCRDSGPFAAGDTSDGLPDEVTVVAVAVTVPAAGAMGLVVVEEVTVVGAVARAWVGVATNVAAFCAVAMGERMRGPSTFTEALAGELVVVTAAAIALALLEEPLVTVVGASAVGCVLGVGDTDFCDVATDELAVEVPVVADVTVIPASLESSTLIVKVDGGEVVGAALPALLETEAGAVVLEAGAAVLLAIVAEDTEDGVIADCATPAGRAWKSKTLAASMVPNPAVGVGLVGMEGDGGNSNARLPMSVSCGCALIGVDKYSPSTVICVPTKDPLPSTR